MAIGAPSPKATLLELAKKKFAPRELTKAEKELFTKIENGDAASALTGNPEQDNPANASDWPSSRVVHAECLAWLCANREASALISHRGVEISGMRVDGDLDLDDAQITFPLIANKCAFSGEISLSNTRMRLLHLLSCSVRGLDAEGAHVEGSVFLQEGTKSKGEIKLLDATIDGSLECDGAQLNNPQGKALNADGAKITGRVFLRKGFIASGEVNFLGATIGGDLDCDGAQLNNPQGRALDANGAKIAGGVFLRNGFIAWGEVNFLGATIGGNLECDGAQLNNSQDKALDADGAKITGRVFLRNRFTAWGKVNFLGATIGGDLICEGAQLNNPQGRALDANGAKIAGGVFLRNGFIAWGEVNFLSATIKNLECDGAQLNNPQGKALDADGAKITGRVFLRNGFISWGEVNFLGATVGGDLDCEGAQLNNHAGYALSAGETQINGDVILNKQFEADGTVSFFGSNITGQLAWYDVVSSGNATVDLRSAKIATLVDEESSWPGEGKLSLDGFTYDRIYEGSPVSANSRLQWLHRQSREKFIPQPYEQLALVLHNMGYEEESREIRITKNRDHRAYTKQFSQEWWWYNVFGRIIGYGYLPWRALYLSIIVIGVGTTIFYKAYASPKQLMLPTDEKGYEKDQSGNIKQIDGRRKFSEDYPKFNPFVFSLEAFTPLIRLEQTSSWAPNASRGKTVHILWWTVKTGSLLRIYLWFHIIAGWILTTLWVGGLTGLVRS